MTKTRWKSIDILYIIEPRKLQKLDNNYNGLKKFDILKQNLQMGNAREKQVDVLLFSVSHYCFFLVAEKLINYARNSKH